MKRDFVTFVMVGLGAMLSCANSHAQEVLPESTVVSSADQAGGYGIVDGVCDSACGTMSGCEAGCGVAGIGGGGRLFRLLKQSDHAFSDFISPISNPVFFEDPRNLTEARFIYFNHSVPAGAGGGDVNFYAVQLRARLSENVSLIATKDGYINSTNPLINDGWADLAAGLKFNLLRDPNAGRLLSAGFTFELPTGEADPLQGNGDGELNLFATGGRRLGCRGHWLSAAGWRIPMDSAAESESMYWSNHFDYRFLDRIYGLAEFNWYHWVDGGAGGIPGVEGLDAFNFGSTGVTGNDIVTGAFGTKFKPNQNMEFGVAWEVPLTERRDIIEDRFTVDLIVRY